MAQDERYIRNLFSGEIQENVKTNSSNRTNKYAWVINSHFYTYDLDQDGKLETVQISKRDSEDWLVIRSAHYDLLFEAHLTSQGPSSGPYKLGIYTLAPQLHLILIHQDAGLVSYLDTFRASELYFLIWDKNQGPKRFYVTKGPATRLLFSDTLAEENLRDYLITVKDYNGDGVRDLLVKYDKIERIYLYLGKGKWGNL